MRETHPIVLVAEDREDDILMLRRAFQQLGFQIPAQFVHNGDETIAYLAGTGRFANREEYPVPDLLLLDLKMPRKTGFEVLEWIQGQPSLSRLRVVVLTTSSDIFEVNRAYQLGAASFLTKPLHFTEFRDTIQAVYNYWIAMNRAGSVERPLRPPIVNPYQSRPETEE